MRQGRSCHCTRTRRVILCPGRQHPTRDRVRADEAWREACASSDSGSPRLQDVCDGQPDGGLLPYAPTPRGALASGDPDGMTFRHPVHPFPDPEEGSRAWMADAVRTRAVWELGRRAPAGRQPQQGARIMGGLVSHCPGAGLLPSTLAGRRFQDSSVPLFPARRLKVGLIPRATAKAQVHDSCIPSRKVPRRSGFTLRHRASKADAKAQSRISEREAPGLKNGEFWGSH